MSESLRRTEWNANDGGASSRAFAKAGRASVMRVSMMIWFAGALEIARFRLRKAMSFLMHIHSTDNVTNQHEKQKMQKTLAATMSVTHQSINYAYRKQGAAMTDFEGRWRSAAPSGNGSVA